jgi:very-short-patch-repair endonuclease
MFKHNKQLTPNEKDLRNNMTKQEKRLWYDFLSTYPVRILRQKVIGSYIVDFYCNKAKLAIEIDGGQHYENAVMDYDNKRTEKLQDFGIGMLRFTNIDINENFEGVCCVVDEEIQRRI